MSSSACRPAAGTGPSAGQPDPGDTAPPAAHGQRIRALRAEMPDLVGSCLQAHTTPVSSLEELIGDAPIHIVEGDPRCAASCGCGRHNERYGDVRSAILGTPQVMVYAFQRKLRHRQTTRTHPPRRPLNIVAGKEIVKELARCRDPSGYRRCCAASVSRCRGRTAHAPGLRRCGAPAGPSGAVERAAKVVLAAAEEELVDPEKYALREA